MKVLWWRIDLCMSDRRRCFVSLDLVWRRVMRPFGVIRTSLLAYANLGERCFGYRVDKDMSKAGYSQSSPGELLLSIDVDATITRKNHPLLPNVMARAAAKQW